MRVVLQHSAHHTVDITLIHQHWPQLLLASDGLHHPHGGHENVVLHLHGLDVLLSGHAEHVHNDGELVPGVLALKEGSEDTELHHDAAETPHVDGGGVVGAAQEELRGAVEPAADVGREADGVGRPARPGPGHVTGAAQVADLDLCGGRLVEKVPGLQVSVSDVEIVEVLEKKIYED